MKPGEGESFQVTFHVTTLGQDSTIEHGQDSHCPRCSLFHLMTSPDLKDHLILPYSLDKEKLGQQSVI